MVYFSHHRDSKVFWAEGWGDIWILYVWGLGKEEPSNSKDFRLWGFPLVPEPFVACVNHIMSLCHLMGPLASFPCKTDKDLKKYVHGQRLVMMSPEWRTHVEIVKAEVRNRSLLPQNCPLIHLCQSRGMKGKSLMDNII